MDVRKAIFAGSWYPGTEQECKKEIEGFIKHNVSVSSKTIKRVGGIVPHAGWRFSGQIACNVLYCLKGLQDPDVIVVFGMHLPPDGPNIIMPQGAWETPLGLIRVHEELAQMLVKRYIFHSETTTEFYQDNTIELQLPLIKYFFPDAKIVAMGVPPGPTSIDIGKMVVKYAKQLGVTIKVLGSTDLTHYGPHYGMTSKGRGRDAVNWVRYENDRRIVELMMDLEPEKVIQEAMINKNACCSGAVAAAIAAARQLGATESESLVYATSYDKSPSDSFVGYAGIIY
ncbi:MAG: AmmeMemoRadiSam system protein B [Candidatus Magnetomorum sp.]|nr:AmmeMemoRadiSam system protein B [Candidatus Magnetomorum sp.]